MLRFAALQMPPIFENSATELAAAQNNFGNLPLVFETNRGQFDGRIKFLSRGQGYTLSLTETEAIFELRRSEKSAVLKMRLDGANRQPEISAQNELAGKNNYFLGEAANWRTAVPTFGRVKYEAIYPGVDRIFYGSGRQLEYDFVVAPEADAGQIALRFEGTSEINIDESGDLTMRLGEGELRQQKPFAYQEINGARKEIGVGYVVSNQTVGFKIGEYDRSLPLVIDPVLVHSTYLGGNGSDSGRAIAIDAEKNVYVTGNTSSTNFPTANPLQPSNASPSFGDVFVTKINAAGNAIVFSTYIGGSVGDEAFGIAADSLGDAHVIGQTRSMTFPLVNPFQSVCPQNGDCVFMASLNPAGAAVIFSTFFGQGKGTEIAADNAGSIYATGVTFQELANLPTMNQIQPNHGSGNSVSDAFVAKIEVQPIQPRRPPFDFDGDGKADVSVFRPSNSVWYLNNSQIGFSAAQFGVSSDKIVPADYDGDGKTDLAVFRRAANSTWYVLQIATNTVRAVQWGALNIEQPLLFDTPVPADYDGDGKADIAIFRSGVWYLLGSQAGLTSVVFGASADRPVPNAFVF